MGQRAVYPDVWDGLAEPGQQVVAQAGNAAYFNMALLGQDGGRFADADDAGNVKGAGSQAVLLPTASDLRFGRTVPRRT